MTAIKVKKVMTVLAVSKVKKVLAVYRYTMEYHSNMVELDQAQL